MSANEDYIKTLTEELARKEAEKQALIQEFVKSVPAEWTPEDLKEKFRTLLAEAYARIAQTIRGDNEALAFKAAQYAMNVGIGQIAIRDDNDPNKEFTELLKTMIPKVPEDKTTPGVLAELIKEVKDGDNKDADASSK